MSGADVVAMSPSGLVSAAPVGEVLAVQAAYRELCAQLLTDADYQTVGKKRFKKKSAYQKLGVAFNVSTEIVRIDHERDQRGRILRSEAIVRAIAPNGRYRDGYGACDIFERCCEGEGRCMTPERWDSGAFRHAHCPVDCAGSVHFAHPSHDIPSTAETRASNRALDDLFGLGEVSAEEAGQRRDAAARGGSNRPAAQSAPQSTEPASDSMLRHVERLSMQTFSTEDEIADFLEKSLGRPSGEAVITTTEAARLIDELNALRREQERGTP